MKTLNLLLTLSLQFVGIGSVLALGSKNPSPGQPSRPSGYEYVDPQNIVPNKALQLALDGFDERRRWLPNLNYLTVIDYTQHSRNRRFYLIDMRSGSVETHVVSHGSGSDSNHNGYADLFSNVHGSKATSLGFFVTKGTYNGSNGYSLLLDGISSSNSNALSRAIVIHGANYVSDGAPKQGRSSGCPALPHSVTSSVIDKIRNGSLILSYHQSHF
jgi:hypothetical protein